MSNSKKDKDLLNYFLKTGWEEINVRGSHHKIKKDGKTLIIPVHGKDMDKGILKSIIKQAGLKRKDVIKCIMLTL